MAKRGYKLQEFMAHSENVNCVRIGKKGCRLLLTGGDDHKVNLWAIGKPTSLMSLCGHATPVESLAFDSAEVLVLAGASSGTVKLWDLEEAKMVRSLTGHRSNCTCVEFHPFGEFFASGSSDTDLKIWDIRKKGCIHTYKGHTQGINAVKFTPDGRWVVSGGFDNVVRIWDLTAGKLLHEFKYHDGHIRSIDFHPLEFLLATGSADRTVKFWDLETFEMIGSAKAEGTGVRATAFHPDGKTLFCGYDNNLKVYSWEPIICHDAIDMGWSTLGDLSIHEGKVIGCSYYRNSVGVWVSDLSCIHPYGRDDESGDSTPVVMKLAMRETQHAEKVELTAKRSTSHLCSTSPDDDAKDIKNIYVDYEKPISSRKKSSRDASRLSPPLVKEATKLLARRQQSAPFAIPAKLATQGGGASFVVPSLVLRENSRGKGFTNSRRESLMPPNNRFSGMPVKATQARRSPSSEVNSFDMPKLEVGSKDTFEDENISLKSVDEMFEKTPSLAISSILQSVVNLGVDSLDHEEKQNVKAADRVAVAHGRTRSLVEKFERRGKFRVSDDQVTSITPQVSADRIKNSTSMKEEPQISGRELTCVSDVNVIEDVMKSHDALLSDLRSRLTNLQMIHHMWERNDIKGAIVTLKKLSDHSVQADVISVLVERMEMITLDLFSCMLPVLVGLLDSKLERHVKMCLEFLVKLVAMFGATIHSSMSEPLPPDLHQEERIECCKQCFTQLQQIQCILPALSRRGKSLARSALELSLVLQDHSI